MGPLVEGLTVMDRIVEPSLGAIFVGNQWTKIPKEGSTILSGTVRIQSGEIKRNVPLRFKAFLGVPVLFLSRLVEGNIQGLACTGVSL